MAWRALAQPPGHLEAVLLAQLGHEVRQAARLERRLRDLPHAAHQAALLAPDEQDAPLTLDERCRDSHGHRRATGAALGQPVHDAQLERAAVQRSGQAAQAGCRACIRARPAP